MSKFLNFEKHIPGIESSVTKSVANYLNEIIETNNSPHYLFLSPDLEKISKKISAETKEVFSVLKFFSAFSPDVIQFKSIFQNEIDDVFYVLQEEDIEEVKDFDTLHNPHDPRIVYSQVSKSLRPAFVLGRDLIESY